MTIIEQYHDYVIKNKDRMCQAQLDLVKYIDRLIRRRDIVYVEKEAMMWINFIEEFIPYDRD